MHFRGNASGMEFAPVDADGAAPRCVSKFPAQSLAQNSAQALARDPWVTSDLVKILQTDRP